MKTWKTIRLSLAAAFALSFACLLAPTSSRAQETQPDLPTVSVPADEPQTTDKPAVDAPKPAASDAKPTTTEKPAVQPAHSGAMPAVKLTPEQEKEVQKLQMEVIRAQAEQAKLQLVLTRMTVEKANLELQGLQRSIMEMRAQDEVNGVYMFMDPVSHDTVRKAISDLSKLSRRMMGPKGERLGITIVLDSPGGDVQAGLALYDHIRDLSKSGHHMTVKVRGMAASMGGILLQAGDTRIIGENAHVLIHEVSGGAAGKVSEIKEQLQFSEALWNQLVGILAKKSKMTAEQIKEKATKVNWWLDSKEVMEQGFADKID